MRTSERKFLIGFLIGSIFMYFAAKIDLYMLSKSYERQFYNQNENSDKSRPHQNIEKPK
jgi:hypothetical protein